MKALASVQVRGSLVDRIHLQIDGGAALCDGVFADSREQLSTDSSAAMLGDNIELLYLGRLAAVLQRQTWALAPSASGRGQMGHLWQDLGG